MTLVTRITFASLYCIPFYVSGMVGVALSRVRSLDTLQVFGLTLAVCVPPLPQVLAFLEAEPVEVNVDPRICCRERISDPDDGLSDADQMVCITLNTFIFFLSYLTSH